MTNTSIFDQLESKVQSYARSFPCVFDQARGAELWDIKGRRYLDFLSGAGSLNYGHNNPVLKSELIKYIENDGVAHGLDLHTAAKSRFLEAMQDIILAPRHMDYVVQFSGPTGTNAVEAAFKLARKVTGRTNIICFTNGFHGVSLGALAATGHQHFRDASGVPLYGTTRMPYDGYFGDDADTLAYLDCILADRSAGIDRPAAVIVETVQGEGGLNAARKEWLRRLQALCHQHDMLLIVDDIQAGCGRTGSFFSFDLFDLQPDVVLLSKSLSGFGLPLAVVLLRRDLDRWKPGEHNGTFRGNNHAFVTAAAALELYWRTTEFAEQVRAKGDYLARRLQVFVERFSPHLVEVRGRGMMRGVLCADPKWAAAVTARAFSSGLILERSGPEDEVIKCMMPLNIPEPQLEEGLDILEGCFSEELDERAACAPDQVSHVA